MQYKDIGKKINDFLDIKKYDLQRQAIFKVKSDDVRWEFQTKLNANGKVFSSLDISHKFKKEELTFKTITNKAPIFTFKSFRFQPKLFQIKAELQDPKLKLILNRKHEKYTFDVDTQYDYQTSAFDLKLAFVYNDIKNINIGVKTEFTGSSTDIYSSKPSDYNIAIGFDRNDDQSFVLSTQKQATIISAGARVRVREDYTGYAQVSFNRAAGISSDAEESNANEMRDALGFAVGISRKLNNNSDLRGVYRSNQTASIMYHCNFPDCSVKADVGVNLKVMQKPTQADLTYKIIFG